MWQLNGIILPIAIGDRKPFKASSLYVFFDK